ncbi:LysM peptidoglycan-binding domain-containing protein [Candidatus Roizmanbacteria bacterium]|nr:LysM peptidoglycan-binding domain-containing protein [Candidatus Roizmanbacteria bacterium]
MIRAYKKKPVKIKNRNYQKLLILTVKEKYFSLLIGLFISFFISTLTYRSFLKNIRINLAFKLPTFNFASKIKNKVVVNKPLRTYVVAEGDDLWNIAEKFYGSGFNAYDISVANKITDSSNISAGQKLIIPQVTPRQPTVGDISAISSSQVTYVENKYVVQPGDSLSLIAQKVYGDLYAWTRIMNANKLFVPDQIEAGMVLIIPR